MFILVRLDRFELNYLQTQYEFQTSDFWSIGLTVFGLPTYGLLALTQSDFYHSFLSKESFIGHKLHVTGWGFKDKNLETSKKLLSAALTLSDFEKCKEAFASVNGAPTLNKDIHICAHSEYQDTCLGDSGGNFLS